MTKSIDTPSLSAAQIQELKEFDTPTVSNAVELLGPWEHPPGVMGPHIRQQICGSERLVGYACTLRYATRHPAEGKPIADWPDYWRDILTVPGPRVSVGQDVDPAPAAGALWGEVQANIHVALGCVGAVIEGAIRDLDGMELLGYPCFAREVVVGHAYAHLIDFGHPVEVGGVTVRPGDLIHADRHGVMVIPTEVAPSLAGVCRKILESEKPLIAFCQDPVDFSVEGLIEAYDRFSDEYPVEGLQVV